jgi:hypothetical protein
MSANNMVFACLLLQDLMQCCPGPVGMRPLMRVILNVTNLYPLTSAAAGPNVAWC